jgi:hypothetical protein
MARHAASTKPQTASRASIWRPVSALQHKNCAVAAFSVRLSGRTFLRRPIRQAPIASLLLASNVEVTKYSHCMPGGPILPDLTPGMRNISAAVRGYGLNDTFFKPVCPVVCGATSGANFS